MTSEIALHCMKSYSELHSDLCELCPIYGQTGSDHCFEDALQYVIGMLEQEPRWIPISERSPKACEYIDGVARHYLVQNEYGDMLVARYDGEGWEQMYQNEYFEDDVIAWMPLPKPYEPQESEDKE